MCERREKNNNNTGFDLMKEANLLRGSGWNLEIYIASSTARPHTWKPEMKFKAQY